MTTNTTILADRYLLAQVANLTLVFAASTVAEIIRIERGKVLILPFYSTMVSGLVNHNGNLLPLVSAHSILQEAAPVGRELLTAIRLQPEHGNAGIVVDRALGSSTKQQLPSALFENNRAEDLILMTPQLLPSHIWQPQQ
jgi:chemotaxis signal transduction protein